MLWTLYIVLLVAGLVGFVMHLVAQFRIAHILHQRYPHQWGIVVANDARHPRFRTWAHLQRVLRSSIPEMFNDRQLTQWHRWWRYGPWIAWPCWIGALAVHVLMRR